MQNSAFSYFLAIITMHFGAVLAMVILITTGYSFKSFLQKTPAPHLTSVVFSDQIRFFPLIVLVSVVLSSLAILVPQTPGRAIISAALLLDVAMPLAILVRTLSDKR